MGTPGTWTTRAAWWRGQSPTQGQSLCCHEANEERKQIVTKLQPAVTVQEGQRRRQKENSTSRSDTRAVAKYNQTPEGRHQQESPTEPRNSTTDNRREETGSRGRGYPQGSSNNQRKKRKRGQGSKRQKRINKEKGKSPWTCQTKSQRLATCKRGWDLQSAFFGRRPLRGSPLEAYPWTSRESNHHRQSVRVAKNDALPTELRGHRWDL